MVGNKMSRPVAALTDSIVQNNIEHKTLDDTKETQTGDIYNMN